jgi:amino acid transporter
LGNGVAADAKLPSKLDAQSIAWTIDLPGRGLSSPIIVGERVFVSATSAMMLVGPRGYSAMARDGFLPAVLAGNEGQPPVGAVVLQGALAMLLLLWSDVASVLSGVGELVVIFAALTMVGLFTRLRRKGDERASVPSLIAAGIYVLSAVYMLHVGVARNPKTTFVVLAVAVLGVVAWAMTKRLQRRPA